MNSLFLRESVFRACGGSPTSTTRVVFQGLRGFSLGWIVSPSPAVHFSRPFLIVFDLDYFLIPVPISPFPTSNPFLSSFLFMPSFLSSAFPYFSFRFLFTLFLFSCLFPPKMPSGCFASGCGLRLYPSMIRSHRCRPVA